ncbi:MAG: hypothetical protein AAGE61_09800 [Pseudomonadota bacterium]
MRAFILLSLTVLPAFLGVTASFPANAEDGHKTFYGTWGTEKQCAREPIKEGGTVLSEPFEIDREWLRQGTFFCRLNWGPIEKRQDGVFTGANAQCGEDSVRGYFLGFVLSNDQLTVRWDFPQSNGPLDRCPAT